MVLCMAQNAPGTVVSHCGRGPGSYLVVSAAGLSSLPQTKSIESRAKGREIVVLPNVSLMPNISQAPPRAQCFISPPAKLCLQDTNIHLRLDVQLLSPKAPSVAVPESPPSQI